MRIILNVAINARDAMPQGGRLTIETANAYLDEAYARANVEVEAGQFVMIASDTGAGMSPETIAPAFDPFFTTKPAGTAKCGGSWRRTRPWRAAPDETVHL
jgi:signal transduction histidine kinase